MIQHGTASWYAPTGNKTASGQRMNPNLFTAAHRSLPFGTRVRVINELNGKEVTVIINDRGPFIRGRIIDLTRAAAQHISLIATGTAPVTIKV
jgi:rare lipoprotein A